MKPSGTVASVSKASPNGDGSKTWQTEMMMEKLRSKAGQFKTYLDASKTLKMALLDKRYPMDTVEKSQVQKCLDSLQHSIKVTSLQAMVERLESVTRQLRLNFSNGLSGGDWFISSEMFYVEVLLEPSGCVKDVKIHHEGKTERQSCEELVNCLSRGDFADFTKQLEGLAAIYQLNADKILKSKAFLALQALETDLTTLSNIQSFIKEPHNMVHKSPVGVLEKRRGGHPMRLTFFVSPYDLLDERTSAAVPLTVEAVTSRHLGLSVEVCIEGCNSSHKLPTTPLISVVSASSGGKNSPMYAGVNPQNSSVLPASFVLRLCSPMPVCVALAKLAQQITEVECGDLSSPQPLLSLITQHCSAGSLDCANNKGLFVTLPDQQHCYFLTEGLGLGAVMVQSIPFCHPAHVPQALALLRQQALFNTLVSSCVRPFSRAAIEENMMIFEVTALSWQQISISFEHPLDESMATLELDLSDMSGVYCRLHTSAADTENMAEYASKVVQRCLSIPITMRALIHKWQGQNLKSTPSNGNFNLALGNFTAEQNTNPMVSQYDTKPPIKPSEQMNGNTTPHGQLGTVMSQLSQSYSNDLDSPDMGSSTSRDSFFPSQLTVEPVLPGQKQPPVLLGLLSEQQKAKKRRRSKVPGESSGSWPGRSPKRKMSLEDGGEGSEDTQGSTESSTPLGTPTQAIEMTDLSDERGLISPPDPIMETFEFEEESATSDSNNDLEELRIKKFKKVKVESRKNSNSSLSSDSKNFSDTHQAPSTIILDLAENKSLVAPSVSITPISPALIPPSSPGISSMLTGMGLERRPGIEIIPIGSSSSPSLPSSITITPIKPEERSKDRSRDDKSKSRDSKKLEEKRLDKKKKRRREGSPSPDSKSMMRLEVMGPPQIPGKQTDKSSSKPDSLSKPVSMSIKSSSSSSSPPLSSSSSRKFSTSPTNISCSSSSKSLPLVKTSTSPTPKISKPSHSPKHSSSSSSSSPIYGSPKHSSPKHSSLSPKQSSSGKPSMSALKSASSSMSKTSSSSSSGSSSGGSSSSDIKMKRDKDKKSSSSSSSGHSSPKSSKSSSSTSSSSSGSSVKMKQSDFPMSGGDVSVPQALILSSSSGSAAPQQQQQSAQHQVTQTSMKGMVGGASSPPTSTVSVATSTSAQHGAAPSPTPSAQEISSTSPCSSSTQTVQKCNLIRNRKGSLSAVIDKLKSAQHCSNEPLTNLEKIDQMTSEKPKKESATATTGTSTSSSFSQKSGDGKTLGGKSSEYQVKSSSDGIKITINKTKNKESKSSSSSSKSSSFPGSPKTHTGLKPGVISGPASKKTQQKPSSSSSSKFSSSSSGSQKTSPSSSSGGKSIPGLSPVSSKSQSKSSSSFSKLLGATDLRKDRDKLRPKTEKSIFSKERRLSPIPHREETEGEKAFKLLAAHAKLDPSGFIDIPKLDPKFQIPKLSRSSESRDSERRSSDKEKSFDISKLDNPKLELKRIDEKEKSLTMEKTIKLSQSSSSSSHYSSMSLSSSKTLSSLQTSSSKPDPDIHKLIDITEIDRIERKSASPETFFSSKLMTMENTALDLATKPLEALTRTSPPNSFVNPKISRHTEWPIADVPLNMSKSSPEVSPTEGLLDFSTSRLDDKLVPSPPPLPILPVTPVHFPSVLSPSVSVHIVKSPAPSPLCSPLVLPSPHSSQPSPCITDDELMDEALIGLGK